MKVKIIKKRSLYKVIISTSEMNKILLIKGRNTMLIRDPKIIYR